jgi:hypothetical protein
VSGLAGLRNRLDAVDQLQEWIPVIDKYATL